MALPITVCERIVCEIINPSDHYTMVVTDRAAAVAICILGEGRYSLKAPNGESVVPLFLLGGHDEWMKETFGKDFGELLEATDKNLVAEHLESVVIGDREDYERSLSAIDDPAKRKKFIADWNDRKRSSMNNIGKRAAQLAKKFLELAKAKGVAPPPAAKET